MCAVVAGSEREAALTGVTGLSRQSENRVMYAVDGDMVRDGDMSADAPCFIDTFLCPLSMESRSAGRVLAN